MQMWLHSTRKYEFVQYNVCIYCSLFWVHECFNLVLMCVNFFSGNFYWRSNDVSHCFGKLCQKINVEKRFCQKYQCCITSKNIFWKFISNTSKIENDALRVRLHNRLHSLDQILINQFKMYVQAFVCNRPM